MNENTQGDSEASMEELFRMELETHCAAMNDNLLALEQGQSPAQSLQELMRAAHSIKGAARIMNRRSVEILSHAMEDCFVLMQHGNISLKPRDIGVLLRVVDFLCKDQQNEPEDVRALQVAAHLSALEKIASHSPHPADASQPLAPQSSELALVPVKDRYLRITAESLSRLLGLAGDSLVESRWLQALVETMRKAGKQQAEAHRMMRSLDAALAQNGVPERARAAFEEARRRLFAASATLRNGIDDLEAHDRRVAQASHRLYLEVLRTRMRPFGDITPGFPRMIRDLAASLGKEVRFEMSGESTQVDREVLSGIETAVTHLLRNAVDHGCETPDERTRSGKPPECVIRLDARHNAGMLVVSVSDDGAGVDPARLRGAASALPAMATASASDEELLDLLLLPGFSLRETVTEISGRGVGLDLVHNTVKRLRGTIRVENEHGRGMRFTLQLPLTISVLRTLVATIAEEPYAIPLAQIERVMRLAPGDTVLIQGKSHIRCGKDHIPLASGRELFGCAGTAPAFEVAVLTDRRARAALIVDGFIGERELVVQSLDQRLGKVPNISAAAIMDDGTPVLILEPDELIHSILHPAQ